jgi:hypothetical protein
MKNSKTSRSGERAERRLVYMSAAQAAMLRRLSERTGISQAALFRRAVDLVVARAEVRRILQSLKQGRK